MNRLALATLALMAASQAAADVRAIADGAPWTTTLPNGREAQMTLNPDGTGRMGMGLLSRGFTWIEQDGAICLEGMPRQQGTGCLSPTATNGGWRLSGDGGGDLMLTR